MKLFEKKQKKSKAKEEILPEPDAVHQVIRINLLPWRAALRKERETRFVVSLVAALAVAGGIFVGVHTYVEGLISYQKGRNTYLQGEIKKADAKIAEIKELKAKRQRLFDRMEVIQKLQSSRPEVVHLLEQLVTTLPEGVHYESIIQKGNTITVTGIAQSNARVATLMRNIQSSEANRLTNPNLQIVTRNKKDPTKGSVRPEGSFIMKITKVVPKKKKEEGADVKDAGAGAKGGTKTSRRKKKISARKKNKGGGPRSGK
ncbi:MAG: PilN domain-containing protein [Gammaproteobacteria bacterium]|nr:PilN domain-containing protein [Gammaproteobacteria bacterium]